MVSDLDKKMRMKVDILDYAIGGSYLWSAKMESSNQWLFSQNL